MFTEGISHMLHFREKPQTGPPYLLYCVPITTARLYKGVPGILLRAETWPFQQDLHSYILICIFTDQSKKLHNDQSECVISTNQDSAHWTNQTVQIKIPHLHKSGPIRDQGGNLYKRASPPWAGPLSGACPPLPWVKSLLLLHPSPGTAVVIGLEVATFSWQHFISVACLIAYELFLHVCSTYLTGCDRDKLSSNHVFISPMRRMSPEEVK